MSCPKCETGLLVIETVIVQGGQQFEEWRCVNCGKRLSEEEQMTAWTSERRARFAATMAAKQQVKEKGTKEGLTPRQGHGFPALPNGHAVNAPPRKLEMLKLAPHSMQPLFASGMQVVQPLSKPNGHAKDFSEAVVKEIFKNMDQSIATQFRSVSDTPPPSPALRELDSLIHDLERQLAETRGVRQLLVQRQAVGA